MRDIRSKTTSICESTSRPKQKHEASSSIIIVIKKSSNVNLRSCLLFPPRLAILPWYVATYIRVRALSGCLCAAVHPRGRSYICTYVLGLVICLGRCVPTNHRNYCRRGTPRRCGRTSMCHSCPVRVRTPCSSLHTNLPILRLLSRVNFSA